MGFLRGVGHGLSGAVTVLTAPKLWPQVLLPFLLSLAAFAGLAVLVVKLLGWLWAVAVPVVAIFLYLPVASLIAAPFNESIAEAVERELTGQEGPPFSLKALLHDLGKSIVHELRKFARWLLLSAAVLALSLLVPVVGSLIGLVGGGYIAARFAAWDALDATFSRWGWTYAEKQAYLRSRRGLSLGLGTVVAVLLFVPVVNAVAMPLGAAGGAMLAVREGARERKTT